MRRGLFALLLLAAGPALAIDAGEQLADPALEGRARALGRELRCVVCQNETIDDSPAELAADVRKLIRERLVKGDSDAAIRDRLQQRYGDFILMRPPLRWRTALLWAAPALGLLIGALLLAARRRPATEAGLSAAEKAEIARRLEG